MLDFPPPYLDGQYRRGDAARVLVPKEGAAELNAEPEENTEQDKNINFRPFTYNHLTNEILISENKRFEFFYLLVSKGSRFTCPLAQTACSRLFPRWSVRFLSREGSRPDREEL